MRRRSITVTLAVLGAILLTPTIANAQIDASVRNASKSIVDSQNFSPSAIAAGRTVKYGDEIALQIPSASTTYGGYWLCWKSSGNMWLDLSANNACALQMISLNSNLSHNRSNSGGILNGATFGLQITESVTSPRWGSDAVRSWSDWTAGNGAHRVYMKFEGTDNTASWWFHENQDRSAHKIYRKDRQSGPIEWGSEIRIYGTAFSDQYVLGPTRNGSAVGFISNNPMMDLNPTWIIFPAGDAPEGAVVKGDSSPKQQRVSRVTHLNFVNTSAGGQAATVSYSMAHGSEVGIEEAETRSMESSATVGFEGGTELSRVSVEAGFAIGREAQTVRSSVNTSELTMSFEVGLSGQGQADNFVEHVFLIPWNVSPLKVGSSHSYELFGLAGSVKLSSVRPIEIPARPRTSDDTLPVLRFTDIDHVLNVYAQTDAAGASTLRQTRLPYWAQQGWVCDDGHPGVSSIPSGFEPKDCDPLSLTLYPQWIAATTSAESLGLRGQNGKQFQFRCPAGSATEKPAGTDMYTDTSPICSAAVHAGVMEPEGGLVKIQIEPGQNSYPSSVRNGISTWEGGVWDGSYRFIKADYAWQENN